MRGDSRETSSTSATTGVCAVPADVKPSAQRRGRRAVAVRRESAVRPIMGSRSPSRERGRGSADQLVDGHQLAVARRRVQRRRGQSRCQRMTVSGCTTIQRGAPVSPTSREGNPKQSVACPEAASRRSVEGRQLLPQRRFSKTSSRWPRSANVSARTTTMSNSSMR